MLKNILENIKPATQHTGEHKHATEHKNAEEHTGEHKTCNTTYWRT
jgi:hypothetical protein